MTEDPDTLKSVALLTIVDLLGEGPIGGLVKGEQSIFYDATPLLNSNGEYNYASVKTDVRLGDAVQTPLTGIADVETPYNVGVQVKTSIPKVITVSSTIVDDVRITISVPSLSFQDTGSGDIHGTTVEYKFEVSRNGAAYAPYIAGTVKTSTGTVTAGASPVVEAASGASGASGVGATVHLDTSGVTPVQVGFSTDNGALNSYAGTAIVQPQIWNGSAWVDYGPTVALTGDSVNNPETLGAMTASWDYVGAGAASGSDGDGGVGPGGAAVGGGMNGNNASVGDGISAGGDAAVG